MTRTRQSTGHGRKGPSRRGVASPLQEKTQKPHRTRPGRYACSRCKRFEGPRRSVEDHCRRKHMLTGDGLQKAVWLRVELEEAAGSSREQPPPQRTPKRQRKVPFDGHSADADCAKKGTEKSPMKQAAGGDGVIKDENAGMGDTDTVTENIETDVENVQEADKLGNITEGSNNGVDDNDGDFQTKVKSPPTMEETKNIEEDVENVQEADKLGNITGGSNNGVDDDGDFQTKVMSPPSMEETSSAGHKVANEPQGTLGRSCGKCKKTFTRARQLTKHKCFASPEQTTKKASKQDTSISGAAHEAIAREAQHFGAKLPPVSTLLKPQETPEGTCGKCKRTFSRARQLIKHKCFAAMDEDKSTKPAKAASLAKSPRRSGTPSAKSSKESKTQSGPKPVMNESQQAEDERGDQPEVTKRPKSSESKEEGGKEMAVEDDKPELTISTGNIERVTSIEECGNLGDASSDSNKEPSDDTAGATLGTVKVSTGGVAKRPAVITTSVRPTSKKRSSPPTHVTVWKTSPASTIPTSVVASPISHPTAIVASPISHPPAIVASTTMADSTGTDGSSSSNVAVKTDVGDLPLEDILQSLEDGYIGGTDADDSVAFRTGKIDGQKNFDDPEPLTGSSSSIVTVAEAMKEHPSNTCDGPGNTIAAAAHLTDIGGSPSKLLASINKMSSDVEGEISALQKKKTPKLRRYAKLAMKQEELDGHDKERIAESISLRTDQVALSGNTPEKVQIGIQNGKSFCLCSYCGTMRLEPDQMKEHLTQHVEDYLPFRCKDCDFLSRKRGRITAHMKKAHQGFLQCECCNYNTYDKDKLDRHYKYWNRDFSNSCKFCHKKIPVGSKEEHLRAVHGKSQEEIADINLTADAFTCRHCGDRLKSRHARRDHEKRHEPHFICPLCPYSTNSETVYINHGKKHRVILVCCQCLAKFHSSHCLRNHLQEHTGQDLDQLYERSISQSIFVASVLDEASIPECDIIGLDMGMRVREEERRVFQQSSGEGPRQRPTALPVTVEEMKGMYFGVEYDCYIKNIAYRHLSMSTLSFMFARYGKRECTHCGFLLHSMGSWKIHVGSHEGKKDFHCTECEYKCRHKFLLERHVLIAHRKQDFPCDLCDQRFPYREYVYLHKRKEHEGGRMKCTFCVEVPFETEVEKEMKKHIIEEHPEMTSKQIAQIIGRKVHFTGKDGILFVKCKYCQKGFNRAAFLRQHVQLVHMQKKTFLCDQCGYKSNTKARLRTHMAVHTEVRDIMCQECGAGFKNKVYLYKHIRRSHKRYATERGAAYCKRTRMKNVITLLQKERQEGSSYERQEIIQKEKAKLFGHDNKGQPSVEGVGVSQPTQINVFQCGDCGHYFENIFTLKNHFMSVHGESPNIPLDFETAMAAGSSAVAPKEQVTIALDALNQSGNTSSVEQLFQCAKCNRMFPDMKSVEHHVKDIHATDTFLISDEGDIPNQELDLAAEVINHLTRESGQSGAISIMQSIVSQSTLDALSIEAQNAATALTTLPDAVLEMSNQAELASIRVKSDDVPSTSREGQENQQEPMVGANESKVEVSSERGDEMEAAHLLQQMGIFQQFTTTTASNETVMVGTPSSDSTLAVGLLGRNEEAELPGEGEDSVTIMLIDDSENKQ